MTDKKKILKDIGNRMQLIRKELGLNQKTFAAHLGISPASLSEIESGKAKPMFDSIYSITKKFRVNVYYLLHGEGDVLVKDADEAVIGNMKYNLYGDWLKKFLYYFRESEMLRYAVMSFFAKYLIENKKVVELEINSNSNDDDDDTEEL